MSARSLKPKHVEALVKQWQREDLSVGTLKNRMATLRWWAQKVDRQNVIARSNAHYGIPERSFVIDGSKAKTIDKTDLDKVRDPHVRMSLELQRAFGPRVSALFTSPDFLEPNRRTHPALFQRLSKSTLRKAVITGTTRFCWRLSLLALYVDGMRCPVHALTYALNRKGLM